MLSCLQEAATVAPAFLDAMVSLVSSQQLPRSHTGLLCVAQQQSAPLLAGMAGSVAQLHPPEPQSTCPTHPGAGVHSSGGAAVGGCGAGQLCGAQVLLLPGY